MTSPARDPASSFGNHKAFTWSSRAAILQMAFGGMILIGFVVWIYTSIIPVLELDSDSSHWIDPVLNAISQPIGSIIAIVGAYLLLKKKKIGLYVSIVSVPILLINNRWIQFVSVIDWLIFRIFDARQLPQSELNLIYFIWVGIYNACVAAIATLLVVFWKVARKGKKRGYAA